MQERKRLACLVLNDGMSMAEACALTGVSRPTGYVWVKRAREVGVGALAEVSRRPVRVRDQTSPEIERELLECKIAHPLWGAKKLLVKVWGENAPISLRTADRILYRNGCVKPRGKPRAPATRSFEMETCNEMWQMDFKAVHRSDCVAFTVIDDCSRFNLHFAPLTDLRSATTFEALWNVFGEYGIPCLILSDNGAPFNSVKGYGPTPLQASLWLLGIRTVHGSPGHPQTQGKVERFHLTAEEHIGAVLRSGSFLEMAEAMRVFRAEYNWERPHESLSQKVPGSRYTCSKLVRPSKMPTHQIPEGATSRRVDASGKIAFRGARYRAGKGLIGQYVEIREEEDGYAMLFAGVRFAALSEVEV